MWPSQPLLTLAGDPAMTCKQGLLDLQVPGSLCCGGQGVSCRLQQRRRLPGARLCGWAAPGCNAGHLHERLSQPCPPSLLQAVTRPDRATTLEILTTPVRQFPQLGT